MNRKVPFIPLAPAAILALMSLLSSCSEPNTPQTESSQPDSEATLLDRARAIHEAALILDAHADIEIPGKPSLYVGPDGLSLVAPDKMQHGGVDAVVMAIAVATGPRDEEGYRIARATADEKLAAVLALAEDQQNNVLIAHTTEELVAAHAQGKAALILGFQNATILGTEVSVLDEFYDVGVRVFALTHLGHNDFADSSRPRYLGEIGAHEPKAEHGGLSALGVAAIERINALGGIVDVSQLSKQATLQVLEVSQAPVIASHSNVQALSDVSRNLSNEEIDRIGETGGVVHVSPFKAYLFDSSDEALVANIRTARRTAGIEEDYLYPFELYWEIEDPEAKMAFVGAIRELLGHISVDDMLDHLDYVVERIGVDHVGIGTDFNHGSEIGGFSDASEALNVTLGLLRRGYEAQDIEKIWGGNFLRVFREAERIGEEL